MPLPLVLGLVGLGLSTATSMGSAIYNATKKEPNIPGPTGEQRMGQALMQSKANQLSSGQGLSETEYNRPLESAQKQVSEMTAQGMDATRNVSPFISNIAAERIAKTFSQKGADIIAQTRKDLTAMDIQTARENLKVSISAQQAANQEANVIARQEQEKQEKLEQYRQQKLQGIATAAGQAAGSMLKLVEIGSGMSTPQETATAAPASTDTGTMQVGNMGVPSMLPPQTDINKAAEIEFGGGFLPFDMFTSGGKPSPLETALFGYQPSRLDEMLAGYDK